jgi:K+-transporting ATPase KdpF subunit
MPLITLTFIAIRPESVQSSAGSGNMAYLAGIIIAIFIFGYLVYTLLNPEKF